MERKNIRIFGTVQGVGLRAKIKYIAEDINIRGTVKNLDDGSVLVVCEADHDKIEKLVNQIRTSTKPAVIRDIQIEEGSPTTNMKGFKVLLGGHQYGDSDCHEGGTWIVGQNWKHTG